jgi:ferredoxin/flavodoxin---NADP+ reductase
VTRSFRVAVVGSGPAGIYAAEELLKADDFNIEVDVLDRLPTPYGLVRYGVAPDHPKIKSIQSALQRTFERDRIRFLGDIEVGAAVTPADLDSVYDAVVYATGASRGNNLGIPGEDLLGVVSATDFVMWYSGHPDALPDQVLDAESVAVVGAGNVALDVARVLAKPVDLLAHTDMPGHVLDCLAASKVREVHLVMRRGPAQAKFTSKELRELAELDDVAIDLDLSLLPEDESGLEKQVIANLSAFRLLAGHTPPGATRTIHFRFWSKPVRVLGDECVTGLEIEPVELSDGRLVSAGPPSAVAVERVFTAVGYVSTPIDGLSFDESIGRVANVDGRVVVDGVPVPKRYVAGWVKRGPSGVVGSNRQDSVATVASLLADLADAPESSASAAEVDALLVERGVEPVTYDGWLVIDRAEIALGETASRARTKLHEWEALRRHGRHVEGVS